MLNESAPHAFNRDNILKKWVDAYAAGLYRRALYLTSSQETAEDLVQETFLAAARRFDSYTGESAPATWLHAILKNKVADHFRERYRNAPARQPAEEVENEFFTPEGRWRAEAVPAEWDNSPDNLLDDPNFNQMLQQCLGHLQPHWRDVVVAKFLTDKKGPDICQELNISPTNFWQILHRAKLQLRLCLEQHWFQL